MSNDKVKTCWLCGGELSEVVIKKLGMPIIELGLSTRARNSLVRGGVECVEQLLKMTDEDLLRLRNMGIGTLAEIKEAVKRFGLDWYK